MKTWRLSYISEATKHKASRDEKNGGCRPALPQQTDWSQMWWRWRKVTNDR